jgi:hypothetical protein
MATDDRYVQFLLVSQRRVLSREQALACGITRHGLEHRLRAGGPWQKVLPGVYLTVTGAPTDTQRQVAALLYAGPESLITGLSAVGFHGIRGPRTELVDVLIPVTRQLADREFMRIHRTRRLPSSCVTDLALRYVRPERAVADAVRCLDHLADARTVVASAVQQRRCTIAQLAEEQRGRDRHDALLRLVLAEVAAGVRSAAEADLRALIIASDLPTPLYNPDLYLDGEFLARPDAWWPDGGVAVEVESREWHLLPSDWERTLSRRRQMAAAGISVLQFSPGQLRTEPETLLRDMAAALRYGRRLPQIVTRPTAA